MPGECGISPHLADMGTPRVLGEVTLEVLADVTGQRTGRPAGELDFPGLEALRRGTCRV